LIKELILSLKSPNRDDYNVYGYRFGSGQGPSIAIVGGFMGHNIDQVFTGSRLVEFLQRKSNEDRNFVKGSVLVIPAVNIFALNMSEKFWPLDNTDIDAMFPGFDQGETTQRIAHLLFEKLKGFDYGVILEGRKDQAACMPYMKLLKSGYEDLDDAKSFGFRFIHYKDVAPMDTATLAYNWQIWNTKTFSVVWGENSKINDADSVMIKDAVIRFMSKKSIIDHPVFEGFSSNITDRSKIEVIKSSHAGIFLPEAQPGKSVTKGEFLGSIRHSMDGSVLEKIYATHDGVISCIYGYPLIFENSIAFRIVTADSI